jgi:hypothetical protein
MGAADGERGATTRGVSASDACDDVNSAIESNALSVARRAVNQAAKGGRLLSKPL